MAVGYDSVSHFTENFKKHTSLSPSQFRSKNTAHKKDLHVSIMPPK
jgi:AraC-like DNA-binding protein